MAILNLSSRYKSWCIMRVLFFITFFILLTGCGSSSSLVKDFHLSGDEYVISLAKDCVDFHLARESNAIDMSSRSLVTQIDSAKVSSTFAYPYILIDFYSSENINDYATALGCLFDRLTGAVVGYESLNWNDYDRDSVSLPHYEFPSKYRDMFNSLGMWFDLDVNEIRKRLESFEE